jgi:hypothetical protein
MGSQWVRKGTRTTKELPDCYARTRVKTSASGFGAASRGFRLPHILIKLNGFSRRQLTAVL